MHVHMHMQVQSQKAPNWQNISELASSQHYCAYATGCTENRGLLTEQAFSLSEEPLLLLGCCFAEASGYYRCQLSCFATDVDQEKPFFPMPFACRTAAKLRLCFQPCFAGTVLLSSSISHERYSLRYSRFPRR